MHDVTSILSIYCMPTALRHVLDLAGSPMTQRKSVLVRLRSFLLARLIETQFFKLPNFFVITQCLAVFISQSIL